MRLRALPLLLWWLAMPLASTAATPQARVSWRPERIVLGRDTQVAIQVQVPGGAGSVHAAASSGSFVSDRVDGGAVRAFQWRPPPERYPQVAVLLFWAEGASPGAPPWVTVARLPLVGQTELDVVTAAGANVEVEVAERRFGPVRANGRGKARVPVEVPPGVRRARVLATRETLRTDATVPLDAPPESPLAVALTARPLPASDGGWLLVAGPAPLRAEDVTVAADGATARMAPPHLPAGNTDTRAETRRSREEADSSSTRSETPRAFAEDVLRYRVVPVPGATQVDVRVERPGPPRKGVAKASVSRVSAPVAAGTSSGGDAWQTSYFLLAGGVVAGGSDAGPTGGVGVTVLTPLWHQRLAAELEVGVRTASDDTSVAVAGATRSQVLALPILLSVRAELFKRAGFSLHGRAGGGPMPVHHYRSSELHDEVKESKLRGMGFLSVQASYRFGRWSALAEARGAWAPVRTPWLDTQLGGLAVYLGARFQP
ncbi:hypothetical protein [Comamonas sp. JC664]|uniref:hypothetical protein n=1 Tax=Comamonas sp. JC664 TaxID=2801917 RepID=UPI0017488277|nr:hypothetical protein [Comamonas sp. JC664]MBL0694588.1 hypothetical protein [Comamonas sp. JC664]GHG96112.1 hypothetical protein GCM10012319_60310 [Comamonas sp. KCTC 72670]